MDILNIPDPRLLAASLGPWIVLSNNTKDPIAQAIDFRTDIKGIDPIDHAMLSINQGEFVWESMSIWNAYRQGPMETFMVQGGQLKFVQLVNNNPAFTAAFSKSVQKRLARPGFENSYDFLGIIGQAVGLPFIHTPGLEYCSVDVIRHLVNACPTLPKEDQIVINNIPRESNPEGLYQIILANPSTFKIYAQWDANEGITV